MSDNKNAIVNGTTFTSDDYIVSEPKVNQSGQGKSMRVINAHNKRGFYISTPLMLTWGVNKNQWDADKPPTYDMSLQFPRDDYATPESQAFLTQLREFENHMKQQAIENSKTWIGKKTCTPEVLDAIWYPMLKYPKDEDGEPDMSRPPTLRVKLPVWDGVFNSEVYDVSGNPLFTADLDEADRKGFPDELITKGAMVSCILQSGGAYQNGGKLGVTWKLFQAVVKPKPSLYGKCHIQLSAEEQAVLNQSTTGGTTEEVNDSDEDDDVSVTAEADAASEVAEDVAQAVAAAPKKKVVRRRKKTVSDDI